jgi:L-fucose mutarotase/ribose pyranase (RbsD/FucU family)
LKLAILILLTAAGSFAQQKPWRQILAERLPYFGDGNWIVVSDSAFPLRSAPGVEMIISDDSHVNTVRQLLDLLAKDGHVRPVIYTDVELKHVAEQDAPGIDAYRQLLSALLEKFFPQPAVKTMPHAGMMRTLDEAAKLFNVLIIKTNAALPYTSVFLELRPGYWPDDAERRLRQSMQ